MARRQPPHWPPSTDHLARQCGVTTVTYTRPIEPMTWCHYCGDIADSRDHIVPDAVGGSSLWWNLVPSCVPCNTAKSDRQACACMFCIRAIALWSLGFRAPGASRGEKRRNRQLTS